MNRLFYGERLRLAATRSDDLHAFVRWYQDTDFTRFLDSAPAIPKSESKLSRWLDDEERSRASYLFAIRTLDTDAIIGFVQIDGIMQNHASAWIAIGIGEVGYRGRGYGYEAMTLALQFAFDEVNLHRVQLTVFSYNDNAIALYEKLGFQREGIFREALLRDGTRHDMLLYGLLQYEWRRQTL
jgi:RimJ/RimL family protein N-acetyltransferase